MEYFPVKYNSRVVIYERKIFIRLATRQIWTWQISDYLVNHGRSNATTIYEASVTRCLNNLFHIWPFTTVKVNQYCGNPLCAKVGSKGCQIQKNLVEKLPMTFKISHSCKIAANLVTLWLLGLSLVAKSVIVFNIDHSCLLSGHDLHGRPSARQRLRRVHQWQIRQKKGRTTLYQFTYLYVHIGKFYV